MAINTVSDVLGTSGAQLEWTSSEGKTYKLSLINLKAQSQIERFIEHDSIESIKAHKEILGDEEYGKQLSRILRDMSQGKYSFGGEFCQSAFETIKGVSALIAVVFNISREEALELISTDDEVKEVMAMVTERSYPKKANHPAE